MGNQRAGLGLDDDTVDIEELAGQGIASKPGNKAAVAEVAKQSGFTSREPAPRQKRRRRKSPYTEQQAIRVRPGMRNLFQDLGDHLNTMDHTTFERALLALIEKEGTEEHKNQIKKLIS